MAFQARSRFAVVHADTLRSAGRSKLLGILRPSWGFPERGTPRPRRRSAATPARPHPRATGLAAPT